MLSIPSALRAQFDERLRKKAIPKNTHWSYLKWLCYYLNFCWKYNFPESNRGELVSLSPKTRRKKADKGTIASGCVSNSGDTILVHFQVIDVGEAREPFRASSRSLPNSITWGIIKHFAWLEDILLDRFLD